MLNFRGHRFIGDGVCACCIGDARVVAIDPTGTGSLRTAFYSTLAIKWRGMRALVRQAIVDSDMLSLGKSLMIPGNPAVQGGGTKIQMFQRWLDHMMTANVLGTDGSFMRDFISRGYDAGKSFAQKEAGRNYVSASAGDREEALFQLAVVELQGIIEAVSQQSVRAVAAGLLHNQRPSAITRAVQARIDSIGIARSRALVELIVIKAFGEASLDVYEAGGIQRVGLLPEQLLTTDAKAKAKRVKKIVPTGRAGTRSRKTPFGPSERTIQRIKKHERAVEADGLLVGVVTAGDRKVCLVCRAIAKRGPYKINKARVLIPAHPRCRCVFVPVL